MRVILILFSWKSVDAPHISKKQRQLLLAICEENTSSIPSPKAKPIKVWLAYVGLEKHIRKRLIVKNGAINVY